MQAELIDRAVEDIADGQAVNWDLLDSQARGEDDRSQLKWLRVLEGIANLHRSTVDPLASGPLDTAGSHAAPAGRHGTGHDDPQRLPHLLPHTWGRYELRDKVGEGSFGSVYRAWDPQLEREIAIKILHRHLTDDRLRDRLLREGRALARIRQANVVSVFGVESHEGRIGLCMEFVQGQTLEDVLQLQGTLSARETMLVGEDVCRALAAVHNAGFLHRDVKARNVMREQAGRIVLMDFGTGREARALEEAGRPDVVGTPLYMAPEVLAGETATTRSDVYSVGVLLYHLVTAEYPLKALSVDALREAHHARRRTLLSERRPDLPTPFVRVIERALAARPEDRHANAGTLLDALGTVLGEQIEPRRSPLVRVASAAAIGTLLLGVLPVALGFASWIGLNATLERSGFSDEGLRDWWVWGLRSVVAPVVALALAWFALVLFGVIRNVALGCSAGAVRLDAVLHRRAADLARRLSLDRVPVLSSWIFLLSGTAAVVAWWHFSPLMEAFSARISTASPDQLALLSPAFRDSHIAYRQTFSAIVFVSIAGWYCAMKLSERKRQPLNLGVVAGGMAVVGLAVLSLDVPYRLLFHNRAEAALWKDSRCYIIGERPDDLLLFCPDARTPRNLIVPKQVDGLARLGVREHILTGFATGPLASAAAPRVDR